jgi:2-keto-4-pentenoate hydratase
VRAGAGLAAGRLICRLGWLCWLLALVLAAPARAACLSDAEVAALFAAWENRAPAANPVLSSPADGECSRAKFNKLLQQKLGAPAGYKAGLTNPAVQRRFKYDSPVRGTLYGPMLLQDGATVETAFGARPLFEADLLVRISSTNVNSATTPAEVLEGIDQLIPFIELPDLLVEDPAALDGVAITAINVGARLGVTGTPLPVQATAAFNRMLRDMQVIVHGDGIELDRGLGSDVLGHPLNAVIWLARDLARQGAALQPGDLVSLGSFSRLLPPQPGLAVAVEYLGLPGNPVVTVNFRQDE